MVCGCLPQVVVVDDDPKNLQMVGSILLKNNYEPVLAASGAQALDVLDDRQPDVILLDVVMPDMSGFEVCRRIKEQPNLKAVPVIFLTAKSDIRDLLEGFKIGGVDYVKKPFHPAELMARIRAHVELKHAREEIKTLQSLIPICSKCKKVRDDQGYWESVEVYFANHAESLFTHGLCPDCMEELYGEEKWYKEKIQKEQAESEDK